MGKHTIFGVERDIDIPDEVFPTPSEIAKMEDALPGCEHGWFDSVYGGAKLHYRTFLPKNKQPKAIIVYVHGIHAHGGRAFVLQDGRKISMALLTDRFSKEGYAFYSFDLYGHGYSEGTRFFIPESFENNKEDAVNFCNLVASMHDENTPVFMMGESYGSTLTILAARQFQNDPSTGPRNFRGIVLAAPAIIGDMPPYPVYAILRYMLAPAFPRWTPFFMPHPVSPERIWRDPEVLALSTEKRFVEMMIDGSGRRFCLGTALNLVLALEEVRNKAIPGFKLPYFIVHGSEDHGVPIEGSEYMWKTAATPKADREFHRQEGAYHDIFGDYVAEESFDEVLKFTEKHLATEK